LVIGRQESAAPQSGIEWLSLLIGAIGKQHNKSGQVLGFTPKTVTAPRSEAGPSRLLIARLKKGDCGIVVDRFRMHRLDNAHLIRNFCVMRNQITEPHPTFAMLTKRRKTLGHEKLLLPRGHSSQPLPFSDRVRQLSTIQLF
jgi:hypothetical protein